MGETHMENFIRLQTTAKLNQELFIFAGLKHKIIE